MTPGDSIDPAVELYVERRLGKTRSEMRAELAEAFTSLETAQREAALTSSREHREVRDDLARIAGQMVAVNASLETVLPLVPAVSALQQQDARDQAKVEARDELLNKLMGNRRWTVGSVIGAAGVLVGALARFH